MPARYGAGGLYYFRLGVENIEEKSNLVIRYQPCLDSASFPNWQETEFRILASNVTSFDIRYQDSRQSSYEWLTDWTIGNRLPGRVQLLVQAAGIDWPAIVVAPRMLPGAGDRSSGFTIGGAR